MREPESPRLEQLWAGDFGDAYTQRNQDAESGRRAFWERQLAALETRSALEVGCNLGGNIKWIAGLLGPENVAGVDVNEGALDVLRKRYPGVDARLASGARLPFDDAAFELVFTMGVLIHQQPETQLEPMMREIVRCSSRCVRAGEYYAEELTEVPYRGQDGALFKQDFGGLYARLFDELQLVDSGFLSEDEGRWDDLTYWVFGKRE
jgi:pseudaminic acid biosynthesis-associated methylase